MILHAVLSPLLPLWRVLMGTFYTHKLCYFIPLCICCIKALKSRRCAQDNRDWKDAAILERAESHRCWCRNDQYVSLQWKCIVKSASADTDAFHDKWWNGNDIKFGKLDDVPDVNKENNKTEHMKVFSWPPAVCWQIQPWIMDILLPSGRYHKNLNCILNSHHKYGFPHCGFSHVFFFFFFSQSIFILFPKHRVSEMIVFLFCVCLLILIWLWEIKSKHLLSDDIFLHFSPR